MELLTPSESESGSKTKRLVGAASVLVGLGLVATGWLVPQDQLGNRWLDIEAPWEAWVQVFLWLTVRLVGTATVVMFGAILLIRGYPRAKLVAGTLIGLAIPFLFYLVAGLANIIADPFLSPRAGVFLRPLGAGCLLLAGLIAYSSASSRLSLPMTRRVSSQTRKSAMWVAAFLLIAGLMSSASNEDVESLTWRHLFSLELIAAAALALAAARQLGRREPDVAAGLILGLASDVLLRVPIETASAVISLNPWVAGAALFALSGAILALNTVLNVIRETARPESTRANLGQQRGD